ncbi:MAG TPA: hypothetical protein VHN20_19485, partial [Beijerinckiaceae bacterium]|nr:hypothetical protein [Beijerinckiaceae bacterium]
MRALLAGLGLTLTLIAVAAKADTHPVAAEARAGREAFVETFRRTGTVQHGMLAPHRARVEAALSAAPDPAERAELLVEHGQLTRLASQFDGARAAFERAVAEAGRARRPDLGFEAAIALARLHVTGTRDYDAAGTALADATSAAGPAPGRKQQYALASFGSELLGARGELALGLVSAARALGSAETPVDSFYAQFGLADLFLALANRCDYEPLYEECLKAAGAADRAYDRAAAVAESAGWPA